MVQAQQRAARSGRLGPGVLKPWVYGLGCPFSSQLRSCPLQWEGQSWRDLGPAPGGELCTKLSTTAA